MSTPSSHVYNSLFNLPHYTGSIVTMTIKQACHVLAGVTLFLLFAVSSATATDAESNRPSTTLGESEARTLINSGKFNEALAILRPLAKAHPKHTNIHFLLALAAIESSRKAKTTEEDQAALLDEAIAVLHAVLIDQPDLERVHLELARAFFYKREDSLARRHFERVLAGKPPAPVAANIRRFLIEIRARRRWSMYLGGAVTPSTNIGRASDSEIINIFGLPFRRDADEPRRSGVGLSVWAGGEYHYPLGERLRLRLGSDAAREEYPGVKFDQTFLSGHAGPLWLMNRDTTVSLVADARQRWLETSPYYLDLGARSEIRHRLNRRVALTGRASWYDREYRTHEFLDGSILDVSLHGTWLVTPTLQANAAAGHANEDTKAKTWRNDSRWGRIGVSVALPRGFTLGGSGEYRKTEYEGNWFPFTDGSARKDRTEILQASIFNRAFTLYGFSPQLVVTHEERKTNAQVYDYKRTNGEVRFVRQF